MIYHYPDIPFDMIADLPNAVKPKGNPGRKKRPTYKAVVCAFDIETTAFKKIKQSVMYIWQFQIGHEITIIGRYWDEFINLVNALPDWLGEGVKLVTYVHNLSYEFQFLSGVWHFAPEDVFCTEPRQILRADMGPLELRCSYRLSNMSLLQFTIFTKAAHRKLSGSRFDYNKIRYPWTKLTDQELAYCVNDVLGLVEAVTNQMTNDGDTLYTIPMTSTGYVRKDIKRAMKTFNWNTMRRMLPSFEIHQKLKQAFRGGNTHADRHFVGQLLHNVHSMDLASAYPGEQINREFPTGRWYEISHPETVSMEDLSFLMNVRHKALLIEVAFLNIRLKDPRWPVPYLTIDKCRHVMIAKDSEGKTFPYTKRYPGGVPIGNDNGRILAAEYLEATLTDIDLKIVLSEYEWDGEMKILYLAHSTYGRLPAQYRDCVINYYQKKTTLKGVAGQEWLYQKSKNKLNAIYGCSVQDPIQLMYDFIEGRDELPYQLKEQDKKEIYEKAMRFAVQSYAWGVWVTAYCRRQLEDAIELIYQQGEKEKRETGRVKTFFVYCDTDSVKYIGDVDFEPLNEEYRIMSYRNNGYAVDPSGKEHYIGVFEYEGCYADFMTWGAKKYICRKESKLQTVAGAGDTWEITIAGVNKDRGARELEKAGGPDALMPDELGRPHFVFYDSGGTEAIYNDYPELPPIRRNGHEVAITRNAYLEQHPYTLGITDDFNRIILHPDLWRDLLDAGYEL